MLRMTVLVAFCAFIFNTSSAPAQGGLILGIVLNNLLDRIESVIHTAANEARGVIMQAGSEAYSTIQAAKVAYQESLNKTVDRLDAVTTKKLQEMETMVNTLEQNVASQTDLVALQAQQIVNTLPFSNELPQLTTIKPKFQSVNDATMQLEMRGNFRFADKIGFKPTLRVFQKTYQVAQNTSQSLIFRISPNLTNLGSAKMNILKMTLSVPYEATKFLLVKEKRISTYDLILGILPNSPGKIVLSKKTVATQVEQKPYRSETIKQHSSNDDDKNHPYEFKPPQGWEFIPESVRLVVEWNQGNENDQWSQEKRSVTKESAAFVITTIHHGFGTSGKVDFHVEATIQRENSNESWRDTPLNLTWGQSRSFPAEPNGWKVRFDSFDGESLEYVWPAQHRYLQVKVQGSNVVLNVPPARDITY
jgi:hypothetical protein